MLRTGLLALLVASLLLADPPAPAFLQEASIRSNPQQLLQPRRLCRGVMDARMCWTILLPVKEVGINWDEQVNKRAFIGNYDV